jgi:hypothetical protein
VIARRHGSRWFIGAIASGSPRTLSAPLRFLGGGKWLVEVVRDGPSGLVREARAMSANDTLEVAVPTHGGFAAIACRWKSRLRSCG